MVFRAFRLPWSRRRGARALDAEIQFHLEMRTAELVRRGLPPDDAESEALRRFGDRDGLRDYCQTLEVAHMRRVNVREWLSSMGQDARFASRQFRRSPGFVATTVVTLALGIGATTAIFSVVNGVLLRPLPYPTADRIVQVWQLDSAHTRMEFSDPNFDDLRAGTTSFAGVAELASGASVSVSGDIAPARGSMTLVTHDFFDVLGVKPAVGRLFNPDEERVGGAPVALLSWGFAQRVFGGASNDGLGKRLVIGDRTYTVVGIMLPELQFPANTDLFIPRELVGRLPSRVAHNFEVVARLRPSVTLDRARRDATALAHALAARYGSETLMADAALVPLRDQLVGTSRPTLLVLLAASIVLLLIACANVANLLVARLTGRRTELALRLALGAGRARLVQQCLVEAIVLTLTGGLLGIALAGVGTRVLLAFDPDRVPRSGEVRLDGAVLLFALGLSLATAVGLALVSAWRATRGAGQSLREALSASDRTMSGAASAARARRTLVVAQVAMTLVLLVAAGLLGKSFFRLLAVDPGFRTVRSVVLDISIDANDSVAIRQRGAFYHELLARLEGIPGITAIGAINVLPLDAAGAGASGPFFLMNSPTQTIAIADMLRLFHEGTRTGNANFRVASGGYFAAMHIPLLEGRTFDARDTPDGPHVAVVSASLARARWPGQSPIGRWVQYGNMDGDLRPFTIIGVVGDVRETGLDAPPKPMFYADYYQRPISTTRMNVVLTGPANPAAIASGARTIVRALRPDVPPRFRTVESIVAESVAGPRFVLQLVGVFGGAALLLAGLGVYSVISYVVAQRARELSIRVALGAAAPDIVRLVLRQGLSLALAGIAVGALAALFATRLLAGLLYGVSARDPVAFGGVALVVAGVALAACWVPARRAARLEAMAILRS